VWATRKKRGTDIVTAATLLVLALPLMVLIGFAIVLESGLPIFYLAERVGHGGARFSMLKFRKMGQLASGLRLTQHADPRLTRVGAVLARTKLDELPQLVNVLRGDMSLVGPRPEHPEFVALRGDEYAEILTVRPGITGLSQLAFADESRILSASDPEGDYLERILPQKCALDRLYVRAGSPRMDRRVLSWTLMAIMLRRPVAVDRERGRMRLRRRTRQASRRESSGRPSHHKSAA
jgi:lipopolysaccharide/colanic/teichoic acid biosynthesis glycosyltransferase